MNTNLIKLTLCFLLSASSAHFVAMAQNSGQTRSNTSVGHAVGQSAAKDKEVMKDEAEDWEMAEKVAALEMSHQQMTYKQLYGRDFPTDKTYWIVDYRNTEAALKSYLEKRNDAQNIIDNFPDKINGIAGAQVFKPGARLKDPSSVTIDPDKFKEFVNVKTASLTGSAIHLDDNAERELDKAIDNLGSAISERDSNQKAADSLKKKLSILVKGCPKCAKDAGVKLSDFKTDSPDNTVYLNEK